MTEQPSPAIAKKRKGRSPSYPAVSLAAALKRVKTLWERERQHPTSMETIAQHWGYKSFNGPASLTLAALKKFGLLQDEGSGKDRRARVSDLAVDILGNPDERERLKAVQLAALNPTIHRELWAKFGTSLPSDTNLRWELTRDRGFTETGADEFIPNYHATLRFAQLLNDGTGQTQEDKDDGEEPTGAADQVMGEDRPPVERSSDPGRNRRVTEGTATYAVPVGAGLDVVIESRFPLSSAEWSQFIAVLTAMKPALVTPADSE